MYLAYLFGVLVSLVSVSAVADYQDGDYREVEVKAATCRHGSNDFRCVTYLRNYDGDTITFNIPEVHPILGNEISVRIKGVDAPEMTSSDVCEQEAALKAKSAVQDVLKQAGRIDLHHSFRGKYFRVIADVTVDGRDLASYLISRGLVVRYDGGKRPTVDWCSR